LDRINDDLDVYIETWNKHQLRTVKGRYTPEQLLVLNDNASAAIDIPVNDAEWYGVEFDGDEYDNENEYENNDQYVQVDPINCPLDEMKMEIFRSMFNPINLYQDNYQTIATTFYNAVQLCRHLISY
jgi:hypothetical protein